MRRDVLHAEHVAGLLESLRRQARIPRDARPSRSSSARTSTCSHVTPLAPLASASSILELCTYTLSISQFPPRPQCLALTPPVLRLCPDAAAPAFDTFSVTVRVRGPFNNPIPGALVAFSERLGHGKHRDRRLDDGRHKCAGARDDFPDARVWSRTGRALRGRNRTLQRAGALARRFEFVDTEWLRAPDHRHELRHRLGDTQPGVRLSLEVRAGDDWRQRRLGSELRRLRESCRHIGSLGEGGMLQHFGHGGALGSVANCALP